MKTIKPSIKNLPSIVAATLDLERWKSQQISIVRGDLVLKHRMMAEAVFPFMRSTFYRWAQLWPIVCPELARGPQVLAVGDLHLDNFGTWRDLEGRLAVRAGGTSCLAAADCIEQVARSSTLLAENRGLPGLPRQSSKAGGRP